MSVDKAIQAGTMKIGTKQTIKQVEIGAAAEVFVAKDADPRIAGKIINLCNKHNVKLTNVETMKQLGRACGIDVGAAMAVRIKD